MNTGIVAAERFRPVKRWFWQNPDHVNGLQAGGMVRCVVLHQDEGATWPKGPLVRIVRLIGEPFEAKGCQCSECNYHRAKNGPRMVQRIEFAEV